MEIFHPFSTLPKIISNRNLNRPLPIGSVFSLVNLTALPRLLAIERMAN